MRYSFVTFMTFAALMLFTFSSCVMEVEEIDLDDYEQLILDDWMALYHPSASRWAEGYYTIVSDEGDLTQQPIHEYKDCWVKYNLTGYNFDGDVCVTRNELVAYQQGTFDDFIRYIPIYQDLHLDIDDYGGYDIYDYIPDCIKLALLNEDLDLRKGSVLTMYIPSDLVDGAATGSTGFTAQTSLADGQPLWAEVEITDVVLEPEKEDISEVEAFMNANGGFRVTFRDSDDEDIEDEEYAEYNETQELIAENWSNAMDTVENVYIYRRYTPDVSLTFLDTYKSSIPDFIYNTHSTKDVDSLIYDIAQEYFYKYDLKGDFIEFSGSAQVWYIGRYLDGFIFDTNILELKEYITGEEELSSTALEYTAATAYSNYIMAWYYSIPQLRYGQWAVILTTSTYAYGEVTQNDIPAYTPLLFYIYVEPSDYDL